jgi:hypothetical protein
MMRSSLVLRKRLFVGVSIRLHRRKILRVITTHNLAIPHANLTAILLHFRFDWALVLMRVSQ